MLNHFHLDLSMKIIYSNYNLIRLKSYTFLSNQIEITQARNNLVLTKHKINTVKGALYLEMECSRRKINSLQTSKQTKMKHQLVIKNQNH